MYDIREMKQVLGSELCFQLLFINSFTGYDTASRIYSVGNKLAFQKHVNIVLTSDVSRSECYIFGRYSERLGVNTHKPQEHTGVEKEKETGTLVNHMAELNNAGHC